MAHKRAADDFDTIRARIEELRRERAKTGRDVDGTDRRNPSDRDTARNLERDLVVERRPGGR